MRVVLDTNVLVRSYPDVEGPSRELLDRLVEPPHALVPSMPILDELERTLGYPRNRQAVGLEGSRRRRGRLHRGRRLGGYDLHAGSRFVRARGWNCQVALLL